MNNKQFTGKIDYKNEDGTVDEWVYDNGRVMSVTINIKRRNGNISKNNDSR